MNRLGGGRGFSDVGHRALRRRERARWCSTPLLSRLRIPRLRRRPTFGECAMVRTAEQRPCGRTHHNSLVGPVGLEPTTRGLKDGTAVFVGMSRAPNFRIYTGILNDLDHIAMTTI